ncbi:o-succinylbenzoate synthase [Oceanithermus desulfurans]|uniref:o-succinylbenzoate synthase n=2 Tax=Oceanithermus desulfurans TaxID=227924 RepID=A0A511RI67_9DEIN|nr:o-succinylbenzoate synthase [Oceanithermus desulfurans]MBB6030374.1 O-succinylbenzoate synthase [Oceanithermus desulfurans]GEM89325.1 o-succinylbenzoate synthase [Oceanithermus desulfurans NBRC 100063]
MKIESAEVVVVELPLNFRFETSFGVQTHRTVPLLVLRGEGLEGYAEGVMTALPGYREETLAGALDLVERGLLPAVVGRDWANPEALAAALDRFRGNPMAKAMVEMAFWDLWARSLGLPLKDVLGGVRDRVPVGVSLGIQPDLEATLDAVAQHLEAGYRRIKLKIKPGWDVAVVAAVRERFPDAHLTVDANSAYRLSDARSLARLDAYDLDYIEQPLAYDDLLDHAQLAQRMETPICLDESITSARAARQALELGAAGVINVKVARVGGHGEARRVHDLARAFGVPVWMGGMLETGVGRAHNIHAATLANFTLPGDTSSASRYWVHDVVNEPLEAEAGWMPVPAGPGLGVTLDRAFLERVRVGGFEVMGGAA